jgi:hypothetical protein
MFHFTSVVIVKQQDGDKKICTGRKIYQYFEIPKASKTYPICDFWYENITIWQRCSEETFFS